MPPGGGSVQPTTKLSPLKAPFLVLCVHDLLADDQAEERLISGALHAEYICVFCSTHECLVLDPRSCYFSRLFTRFGFGISGDCLLRPCQNTLLQPISDALGIYKVH